MIQLTHKSFVTYPNDGILTQKERPEIAQGDEVSIFYGLNAVTGQLKEGQISQVAKHARRKTFNLEKATLQVEKQQSQKYTRICKNRSMHYQLTKLFWR